MDYFKNALSSVTNLFSKEEKKQETTPSTTVTTPSTTVTTPSTTVAPTLGGKGRRKSKKSKKSKKQRRHKKSIRK